VERCEIDSHDRGSEPAAGSFAYGDKAWVSIKAESFTTSTLRYWSTTRNVEV